MARTSCGHRAAAEVAVQPEEEDTDMPDERDKLQGQNDETETDDVEAHKLMANDEPDSDDEDVEAHKLA